VVYAEWMCLMFNLLLQMAVVLSSMLMYWTLTRDPVPIILLLGKI